MFFDGSWARRSLRTWCNTCNLSDFFLSFVLSRPLLVRLQALRGVVLFLLGVGGVDREVEEEEERLLCRLSFSFCFRRPLCGVGHSLSDVVAACALSSSLSY